VNAARRDLPVEEADRYRFCINLKTAKALDVAISTLLRAEEVIE